MFRNIAILAACLIASASVFAQPTPPANDYQYLVRERANIRLQELKVLEEQAKALQKLAEKMDAGGAAAVGAQMAARAGGLGPAGAPTGSGAADIPPPPTPAPECGFWCGAAKFATGFADFTLRAGQVYAPIYAAGASKAVQLASIASNEAVALGDQRARVDSLAVVSNGNASIATGGFAAMRGQGQDYAAAFRTALERPTTQITVNGNGNTTGGRDATATTNTVECVTTQTNRSGDPASGNATGAGPSGATTAAPATTSLAKECVAGR